MAVVPSRRTSRVTAHSILMAHMCIPMHSGSSEDAVLCTAYMLRADVCHARMPVQRHIYLSIYLSIYTYIHTYIH